MVVAATSNLSVLNKLIAHHILDRPKNWAVRMAMPTAAAAATSSVCLIAGSEQRFYNSERFTFYEPIVCGSFTVCCWRAKMAGNCTHQTRERRYETNVYENGQRIDPFDDARFASLGFNVARTDPQVLTKRDIEILMRCIRYIDVSVH